MKKILVAFDGSFYSVSALNYAIQIAKIENAMIAGIFLEDITAYHQFSPIFKSPDMIGLAEDVIHDIKADQKQNVEENIQKFRKTCMEENVPYAIEHDSGIPSRQIVEESMFADLLITGSVTYFSNISYTSDHNLVSDILAKAHCPVLVVPEKHYPIQSVIMAFDGSASSTFAIKQFLYLFPNMIKHSKITLLSIVEESHQSVEGEKRMFSLLQLTAINPSREKITGRPADEILHYAKLSNNSIIVMGAYGRNAFSKFFKASLGAKIVKAKSIPVFVAHE